MARDDNGDWTPYIPHAKKPVITVSGSNDEALGVENLNGEVLHAAASFYRKQAAQQGNGIGQYSNKVIHQNFADGSSAIFRYQHNYGSERLSIRWSAPKPVPSYEIDKEAPVEEYAIPDFPTVWVFHDGHEITVFMVGSNGLEKLRHKICKQSSWGYSPLLTSQFSFGKHSTMMSPLRFDKGIGSVGANHCVSTPMFSPPPSERVDGVFLGSVFGRSLSTSTPSDQPPLQNSDGTRIYAANDVYTMASGKLELQGHVTNFIPYAISSDGVYDFGVVVQGWRSGISSSLNFPDEVQAEYDRQLALANEAVTQTGDVYSGTYGEIMGSSMGGTMSYSGHVTPYAHIDAVMGGVFTSSWGIGTSTFSGSDDAVKDSKLSISAYSHGNKDRVELKELSEGSASCITSLSFVNIGIEQYGYEEHNLDGSTGGSILYGEVSASYTEDFYQHEVMGVETENQSYSGEAGSIQLIGFPPATDDTGFYKSTILPLLADGSIDTDNVETTFHTPYQSYGGEGKGWLHVSNGKHYIQGFIVDDVPYLYYDGQNMSGMLAGISMNAIQTIVMNIPLSRIDYIR